MTRWFLTQISIIHDNTLLGREGFAMENAGFLAATSVSPMFGKKHNANNWVLPLKHQIYVSTTQKKQYVQKLKFLKSIVSSQLSAISA